MRSFTRFACADWSGAKGSRHPGIALAVCGQGDDAPRLVTPPRGIWSRQAVADWLLAQNDDLLIGFDFSFAPPIVERGSYLPGDDLPLSAKGFWAYVDAVCDDPDLGAASFLEYHHRRHFYFGAADGTKSDFLFWRQCEILNKTSSGKTSTVYDAIGASQVAKASFAGMRFLNHVGDHVAIWPFDSVPERGTVVVEIYTTIAARAAGVAKGRSKIRDSSGLDAALLALGSRPHQPLDRYTDHATDAMVTAAWLRSVADNPQIWAPKSLNSEIAATEGWTFGVI
ncbi:hypothetical protein [Sphingorhabdus sp.]|uniref:hypothetical protein n=1 Tax=Sphingorhabdus sp. TaxID=1902408 RepID=UPI003919EABA